LKFKKVEKLFVHLFYYYFWVDRVDFLVAMTFVLDLWHWTTKEVVIFLVKPSTEEWRCRFACHPVARRFSGPADALASHVWDNLWGTLITSVAQGAPMNRYVWICALANRQWAGNEMDIDFDSMVERTKAVVVANPIPGGLISSSEMSEDLLETFIDTPQGMDTMKQFTVSRIWCIGTF
jgi:hypothetical protein